MNQQQNLYAAPKARLETFADQGEALWRDGKLLVCRRDAVFPGRCIKCNEPADEEPVRFKLNWHHGGWYVLFLINAFLYVVVAMVVRKRATIEVGLCELHKRRRMLARLIGWGGLVLIVLCFWIGISREISWLVVAGAVALLPWVISAILLSPQLRAARIDKEWLRVRGCGRNFLDTLPEHPG